MSDIINHPEHYAPRFAARPIECIDVARYLGFCNGSAFKYIWRAGRKGDAAKRIEDLRKAKKYLEWLNDGGDMVSPNTGATQQARAVFRQLEPPLDDAEGRAIYSALLLILHGLYEAALTKVEALLRQYGEGAEG